jgi:7-cyano-7-deazaguanine synthase
MKRAIVLLSGGIDSTTTLALAKSQGFEIYAISFDYGQRHKIELEMAQQNAKRFGVKRHLVVKFNLRDIGGSALTSNMEVPKNRIKDRAPEAGSQDSSNIPVTYVPARNTIFLSFALAWAETIEAADIFIGANAIDYSGYPDCRPEYIKAFEDMANLATKVSVEGKIRFKIHTPLIKMTKAEIIKKGIELGVDYSRTWSCYDPQKRQNTEHRAQNSDKESPGPEFLTLGSEVYVPCMQCDSCLLRMKGFKEAGIIPS